MNDSTAVKAAPALDAARPGWGPLWLPFPAAAAVVERPAGVLCALMPSHAAPAARRVIQRRFRKEAHEAQWVPWPLGGVGLAVGVCVALRRRASPAPPSPVTPRMSKEEKEEERERGFSRVAAGRRAAQPPPPGGG